MNNFQEKVSFICSVADLLRGDSKQSEYGRVILPLTVMRRLDCVLEPKKDAVTLDYLQWTSHTETVREQLRLMMTGSCQPNFGPTHLSQVVVSIPPHDEQEEIANYLNENAAKSNAIVARIQAQVTKLQEYRQTLILAAFTGEIDVIKESAC